MADKQWLYGAVLAAIFSGTAGAEPTYWSDSAGEPVVTGAGECWKGISGSRDPACTGEQPVEEAAAPVDSDGDGVVDADDRCPGTPAGAAVDAAGCPLDSDGDGVADYRDECPGTPAGAQVNAAGCIERVVMEDLQFAFGKAELTDSARQALDSVADQVVDNPNVQSVLVTGHTDSVGSEAYNQRLSEERAAAVADYFVSRGVPAAKVESEGKGESSPVADNGTEEGRSRNRRVEIDFSM